ncbi:MULTISPECIES: amino acid permease [Thermoactinomyces]|uniref:Amino acid permease n=1 Tax=Thermoactinomyces vulgaris TaxID=2026 RepID=A0ABS0QHM9_THEVU|nr:MULTISPECIES: amino acid permease [Thermoactinomyces]MBH8582786.1 amino acid permease [Thermoactinomyces sp. CICC 10735]MBH8585577.1 amino acid permease [Thermoactinomyces sp. CICC 10520]MBI0386926.1 amino acid permease [Thermoactinomyces sp. CICC 24227]MBI0391699.1 amino acid permease [Thermoactinomyces sp. CICC 24226]MBA4551638.1 amino acid permease [Thermoactinomyces vulgaris]
MNLFRKKDISNALAESQKGGKLKRDLGAFDLTMLGIGAVIGTGIFVLTGAGALKAGPALAVSFVIAAIACAFSALAYAEFASMAPVSGSAYTYSYATLGEIIAWIIGWDLVLEYMFAVSSVSVGWSGYFQSLLGGFGIHFPDALTAAPGAVEGVTTYFNLPAFLIVMIITFLLSRGITESKKANNIMVIIKVAVVLLFIIVGAFYVKPSNWEPFAPFGFEGIFSAAALVFFAFIGFDAVAAAAEETRNPKRDLPIGLLTSLGICALLYVIVTLVMTGIVPYQEFAKDLSHPISLALQKAQQDWFAGVIDLGAIMGMTTVILVMLYGQTRIFFSMSRDGLLPKAFSWVHPKYKTPYTSTWIIGTIAAFVGALLPLEKLAELVNIGTLFAFTVVSLGVIILRYTQPDLPRPFRCPGVPVIPAIAIFACLFLISNLAVFTWIAFAVWFLVGLIIYFTYSRRHSLLNQQ